MTGEHALCHGAQLVMIDDLLALKDEALVPRALAAYLETFRQQIVSCEGACALIPRAKERIRAE